MILFELYNEPHDVSWAIWRNGGGVSDFVAVGMQALYLFLVCFVLTCFVLFYFFYSYKDMMRYERQVRTMW